MPLGAPIVCCVLPQYDWYTKVTSVVVDVVPRHLGGKGRLAGLEGSRAYGSVFLPWTPPEGNVSFEWVSRSS